MLLAHLNPGPQLLLSTLACGYKFHALHPKFTVPPMGDAFGIQSNICGGIFFAEIVNVLRPSAIFAEELHRGCLTGCLSGF